MFPAGRLETLFCTLAHDIRRSPLTQRGMKQNVFSSLPLLGALLLALPCAALAQPPGGPGVELSFSSTATSDLERAGKVGELGVDHYAFTSTTPVPLAPNLRLLVSAAWSREDFQRSASVPLPSHLERAGLSLGVMTDLGQGWRMRTVVRSNVAGESLSANRDTFEFGGLWSFDREVSPTFSWSAGLMAQSRGKYRLLPLLGLRWQPTPDWSVVLGAPHTRATYRLTRSARLHAGLGLQGGTYHVGNSVPKNLRDTYLDYRELRVGTGLEVDLTPRITVSAELGQVVNRRFDYYDRDYRLTGKSAAYAEFAFRFRL